MYDKIKTLISRNDFVTAEKLLEKHNADLSGQQKKVGSGFSLMTVVREI